MNNKKIAILLLISLFIGILLFLYKRELFPLGASLASISSVNDVADVGIFGENISISPNNKWVVYVGVSDRVLFDGMPDYNIIAYDLVTNQKYVLGKKGKYGTELAHGLDRNCWNIDSTYCYIKNDTGMAIDFTGSIPVFIDKKYNTDEQLTCSDCSHLKEEKIFSKRQHGYVSLSPDNKYEILSVSYGNGFVSQPYIYLMKNSIRRFVTKEAYTVNWSSDSKSVYFTKRDDTLYRLDL